MARGLTLKSKSMNGCMLISDPLKFDSMILRHAAWLALFLLFSFNGDTRSSGIEFERNMSIMLDLLHNIVGLKHCMQYLRQKCYLAKGSSANN